MASISKLESNYVSMSSYTAAIFGELSSNNSSTDRGKGKQKDPNLSATMKQLRSRRSTPTSSLRHKSSRVRSAFGQGEHHCLCTVFSPVLKLGQVYGIIPVSIHRKSHTITHSKKSIPWVVNTIWLIGNIVGWVFWAPRFYRFLRGNLNGTDFYTNLIAITVQMISSIALFASGCSAGTQLPKAWTKLHDTVNEIGLANFKLLKYAAYMIPLYLLQESTLNIIYLLGELWYDGWGPDSKITLQLKTFTFFANIVPNLSALIFALLVLVIARNFNGINQQLTELQEKHFNRFELYPDRVSLEIDGTIVYKLAKLRILHENLCEVVRRLELAFGLQMQAIFATTAVSFLVGIYSLIVALGTIWAESDDKLEFFIKLNSTALMPIFAALRIMIIVLSGQYMMNAANEAGQILNGFNIINATDETKQQVRKFLDKVGMFPMQLTANGIIELSASFLGPAAGNVITYVLVMMQFRLDDNPDPTGSIAVQNGTSL